MHPKKRDDAIDRLARDVPEAARMVGCSAGFMWGEIAKGRLKAVKMGRRTKITEEALADYLAALPRVEPSQAA